MKSIVITGSTKGIGRGLAEAFLESDCRVVISGRSDDAVQQVVAEVGAGRHRDRVQGVACDVRQQQQVQALWDRAVEAFGRVDVWINNAGVAHPSVPLWELTPAQFTASVEANLIGTIHGSQVAFRGMQQQGGGAIFNLEGLGSVGPIIAGTSVYSCTKSAISRLTKTMAKEAKGASIIIGTLMPGMVLTDLLLGVGEERSKRLQQSRVALNLMAQPVDVVAPYLAKRALSCKKNGARISFVSPTRVVVRAARAWLTKRDVVSRYE